MRNFAKWLGAGLGFTLAGPIGSILGYVVGSLIDGFTLEDFYQTKRFSSTANRVQSGDFEVSLLLLAANVIKADGKVDQRELRYVRDHFKRMYGTQRANHAFKLFKGFVKTNKISTYQVCTQIRQHLTHAARLQLIHFLFGIANVDGVVKEAELKTIKTIAGYLYISEPDFNSIKAMFYQSAESAYQILEIDKSASVSEIKKAYRKMVKKYHPDKLRHLGEEHMEAAEEKFRQVQKAYEKIQQERGF